MSGYLEFWSALSVWPAVESVEGELLQSRSVGFKNGKIESVNMKSGDVNNLCQATFLRGHHMIRFIYYPLLSVKVPERIKNGSQELAALRLARMYRTGGGSA